MNDPCVTGVWHCGGLSERTNVQMLRLAGRSKAMGHLISMMALHNLALTGRVVPKSRSCWELNIPTLLSSPSRPCPSFSSTLSKTFGPICMAQTVRRKQKRKQPSAIEAQDSTPPAPKRVRVAQAQTARKSTGGGEPSHRPRGGDDGDDDDGDDDNDRGGAPRAGPSKQRMWCSLRVADLASLVLGTGHIDALVARESVVVLFV